MFAQGAILGTEISKSNKTKFSKLVSIQVASVKDGPCYHFTMDRKDVYVPVPEAMVEIFKKLHSMFYVHTHSLLPRPFLPSVVCVCALILVLSPSWSHSQGGEGAGDSQVIS